MRITGEWTILRHRLWIERRGVPHKRVWFDVWRAKGEIHGIILKWRFVFTPKGVYERELDRDDAAMRRVLEAARLGRPKKEDGK